LILISWLYSSIIVIRNWKKITSKIGNRTFRLLTIIYLLAMLGIILSLALSADFLLWICVGIGFLINILYLIYAFNK
jgi:hypothetical protein